MSTLTKQFPLAFCLVSLSFSFLRHVLHFYLCIFLLIYHLIPNFLSNLCISSNLSFSSRPLIFSNYLNYTHTLSLFLSVSLFFCADEESRTCWSPRICSAVNKFKFRHSAFPFSPVMFNICSWTVPPDPSPYFYCSLPSLILSLSSPSFFSTSSSSRSLDEVS